MRHRCRGDHDGLQPTLRHELLPGSPGDPGGGGRLVTQGLHQRARVDGRGGLEEDLEDEKYATFKGVTEHTGHIDGVIARFVAHLPADEVAHGGQQRQFNWGSVRAPEDLLDDGQLQDRGFWIDVVHPELGRTFKYPGAPAIHNGSLWRISRRAPLVGEHNREIYGGELGLEDAALVTLTEAGVL